MSVSRRLWDPLVGEPEDLYLLLWGFLSGDGDLIAYARSLGRRHTEIQAIAARYAWTARREAYYAHLLAMRARSQAGIALGVAETQATIAECLPVAARLWKRELLHMADDRSRGTVPPQIAARIGEWAADTAQAMRPQEVVRNPEEDRDWSQLTLEELELFEALDAKARKRA